MSGDSLKTKQIAIINYGMGNIGSVSSGLEYLGVKHFIANNKSDLEKADAYILPGVGAFKKAMDNLHKLDFVGTLSEQVLGEKKPILGICLGMQLLAQDSEELGFTEGLGWIDGHVYDFKNENNIRIPHVGWNNILIKNKITLFERVENDAHFYFDHSLHLDCDDDIVIASCEYGGKFVAAIQKDNIMATQFHPEKSQRNGLKFLRNFTNSVLSQ